MRTQERTLTGNNSNPFCTQTTKAHLVTPKTKMPPRTEWMLRQVYLISGVTHIHQHFDKPIKNSEGEGHDFKVDQFQIFAAIKSHAKWNIDKIGNNDDKNDPFLCRLFVAMSFILFFFLKLQLFVPHKLSSENIFSFTCKPVGGYEWPFADLGVQVNLYSRLFSIDSLLCNSAQACLIGLSLLLPLDAGWHELQFYSSLNHNYNYNRCFITRL